jgi:cell division protease FtsH
VVCCGGRIAEKMFTGEISTGAAQDIAMATEIARKMVCTYGMSERFGFQAFNEPSPYASAEAMPPAFSEETSRAIDAEVAKLVSDAYAEAERLIGENRDKVELLAKTLLEQETMDGRDVAKLVGIAIEEDEDEPPEEEPPAEEQRPAEEPPKEEEPKE